MSLRDPKCLEFMSHPLRNIHVMPFFGRVFRRVYEDTIQMKSKRWPQQQNIQFKKEEKYFIYLILVLFSTFLIPPKCLI